ncbi:WXG100-like domain-containing protein [Parasphingorhabdus pacifica]
MTLHIPSGLQDFASVVVGADWPEGDEDALRRLRDAWEACGEEVGSVTGDAEAAIRSVLGTMEGETAKAFEEYGKKLTEGEEAPLVALEKLCEELSSACQEVAAEVEYTKISIIAALAILAAQVALMLALAAVTFGTSTAGIAAAQTATQAVVRGLMQALMNTIQQIVLNVAVNVAVDVGIQAGQMDDGNRDDWDEDKTASAAKSGAAAGLGAGIAGGVFGGVAKGVSSSVRASKFMNKLPDSLTDGGPLSKTSEIGGKSLYGAAEGTAGGSMFAGMNNSMQNPEDPGHNEQNMGSGAAGGALGGVAGGGANYTGVLDEVPTAPGGGWDGWHNWDTAPPLPDNGPGPFKEGVETVKNHGADEAADVLPNRSPENWVPAPHMVQGADFDTAPEKTGMEEYSAGDNPSPAEKEEVAEKREEFRPDLPGGG